MNQDLGTEAQAAVERFVGCDHALTTWYRGYGEVWGLCSRCGAHLGPELMPPHALVIDFDVPECTDGWHDAGADRRPDCPTCGVEDDDEGQF